MRVLTPQVWSSLFPFFSSFLVCVLNRFVCVQPFETAWTIAHQAPLSMGFSRQEYWSGLPCGESSRPRDQACVSGISCIEVSFILSLNFSFLLSLSIPRIVWVGQECRCDWFQGKEKRKEQLAKWYFSYFSLHA